jgi:predicted DNA-binding protein (UPF0278 family)
MPSRSVTVSCYFPPRVLQELDGYIAADCPLCGYVMIQSLSLPLISDTDVEEMNAWAI